MFIYSKREGTVASKREDQIPEDIKHERFNKLKELFEAKIDENNKKYIGTVQNILIEGPSKYNENTYEGRTSTNKVVIIEQKDNYKIGDVVKVKIIENHKWYLKGEAMCS